MRKYILIALILLAGGIAASIYLIPNASDVAQMQAKDVKAVDLGNVDPEAEYAQGRRTFPIISALADKRVAAGDRAAAVKLLEEYVASAPTDVNGRKKLAEQYQLSGNNAEFSKQIEAIAAAEPTEANLRVLSDIYNANKEYAKQVVVLQKILEVTQGVKPESYVDLATIQVALGDTEGALKTVEALKAKHPAFSSYPMTRIMVSVLADKGEVDRAFDEAKKWIDTTNAPVPPAAAPVTPPAAGTAAPVAAVAQKDDKPKELADLTNILHYSGHADKAVALVEPHLEMLDREPELVLAYVNAAITAGQADKAYAVLQKIDESGKMIAALYPPYLDLALKREDVASAETIANKMDVTSFTEEQALNVIEVARSHAAPTVLATLTTRFGDALIVKDKPVLAAVIAILTNDKTQDAKIDTALGIELTSTQRIRLAESCARAKKTPCFDAIVKQYPPMEQMTPVQVGEYAQLFIIANRAEEILLPVSKIATVEQAPAIVQTAYRRLAAAAGRLDVLKPWLEANANSVPIGQLQELFYLANDRGHGEVASDIAERLYARDPSPMNREILVSAYIGAGAYDKAMPLLREQVKDPNANDGLYLSALSKLARKDTAARKELADYAQAALQSRKGDARQQLNYAYILINNGRKETAIPYAKQYAAERGGEWKKLYAQLTQKPKAGTSAQAARKLTREQMVAMAGNKSISAASKRQIAFNLLNDGYKADATVIFKELATDKGPDSQEVKDLMYLWGGKLDSEQLAWVQGRAAKANAYDKERWAGLIHSAADDTSVLRYVSATPDALYNRPLRQKYFRILAATGSRQNYDTAMRNWVAQTTDVPALADYASIAQANGYREAAVNGYERVLALDPNNAKALSQLAALDFSKGKYKAADRNLNQYLANEQRQPDPESNPAQANFYKAELLRRQGDTVGAQAAYGRVVQLTTASGTTAPDALSRLYTAQFRLGQHRDAMAGFNRLLEQNPDDKGVLADYMSVLIEYRYLDEATRVANQYDKNSPYYRKGAALVGRSSNTAKVQQLSQGRELKITFSQPIEDNPPVDLAQAKKLAWVESSTQGYDSVSISAKPGYVVRYVPTSEQQFTVVATPVPEYSPQVETQRQQDLRLQLLYARIEQDSGQPEKAQQRLAALKQYYPQDPQLLSFDASVKAASGNTGQAIELYQVAQKLAPENEDFGRAVQALKAGSRGAMPTQFVKVDHEYRNYGANHEQITTISAMARVNDRTQMGFNLMNDEINPKALPIAFRYGTGIQNEPVSRQQAEIFVAHYLDGGDRLQGSLFASGDIFEGDDCRDFAGNRVCRDYSSESTLGAGLYYGFNNMAGRSELLGEYHKPYWDFPEAAYQYATRDRVGIKHYASLNTGKTGVGVEASLNNYNIEPHELDLGFLGVPFAGVAELDGDQVVQSGLIRFNVTQELQKQTPQQPYFGIGYGFDGEYIIDREEITPAGFNRFRPFDFRSRENHQLTAIYRDDWTSRTHVYGAAGYLVDRLGDNGPVVEAQLRQDLTDNVELGVRARYGLAASANGSNTEDDAVNLGAHLMYKF